MSNALDLLLLIKNPANARPYIKQYIMCLSLLLLLSCSGERPNFSQPEARPGARKAIVATALVMKGKPYRYGGANPKGFDCSGLVQYVYKQVGLALPRTTYKQYRASQPVYLSRIQPGDLVFYRINNSLVSHVGIYIGNNQFIHAPKTGETVSITDIKHPFWEKRFVGAGSMLE